MQIIDFHTHVYPDAIAPKAGHIHPITRAMERMTEIFIDMGFSVAEGPEVEIVVENNEPVAEEADFEA